MTEQQLTEAEQRVVDDVQLTRGRKNYFVVGPPCFDNAQVARLRELVDTNSVSAEVYRSGAEDELGAYTDEGRRTRAYSVDYDQHRWVYEITDRCFLQANTLMRYDIVPSLRERIQLLRYDAEEQGEFRWHADTLPSDLTRKITLTVPLNDPAEYEGGSLQFNQGGIEYEVRQLAGRPIAFPSWLVHRVTPVTRGRRYSLVTWCRGPSWR